MGNYTDKKNRYKDDGDVRNVKSSPIYEYGGKDYEEDKWYEDNNQINPKWEQDEGTSWVDEIWNPWREKNGIPTKGSGNKWGGSSNNDDYSNNSGSYNGGYGTGGGYTSPSMGFNGNYLEQQKAALEAAKREAEEARRSAYNNANKQLDDMTTKSEQQAYLNRKKQEKTLPSALAINGYSGGASESAMNDIGSVYQNALNSIKDTKAEELGRLTANLQAGIAADNGAYDVKIAETLSEADRRQREIENQMYEREHQNRLDEQAKKVSDAAIAAKMEELNIKKQKGAGGDGTDGWMHAPAEGEKTNSTSAEGESTELEEENDPEYYINAAEASKLKTISQQLRDFDNPYQAKAYLLDLQMSNQISKAQCNRMMPNI